ncbi:uncharacterized protein MELLADRAFT_111569 [Melampsora larici-populina 98AG31]|uniref:Uncharacterized protein n=1 Tax=Melampsora larici-populina (strain 98AG31 / pathotype 3-4-7) TaxID=747676 RepID=F4S3M1_MELLP|nr:uncharacterized protein MELLADRAFT_111569 [Melampsora larici-populina 98AG31]EGG00696.1 hypothetical protein MELLADRAFT_111569 [Melampsora larici-populina 98AG31]
MDPLDSCVSDYANLALDPINSPESISAAESEDMKSLTDSVDCQSSEWIQSSKVSTSNMLELISTAKFDDTKGTTDSTESIQSSKVSTSNTLELISTAKSEDAKGTTDSAESIQSSEVLTLNTLELISTAESEDVKSTNDSAESIQRSKKIGSLCTIQENSESFFPGVSQDIQPSLRIRITSKFKTITAGRGTPGFSPCDVTGTLSLSSTEYDAVDSAQNRLSIARAMFFVPALIYQSEKPRLIPRVKIRIEKDIFPIMKRCMTKLSRDNLLKGAIDVFGYWAQQMWARDRLDEAFKAQDLITAYNAIYK